MNKRIQTFCLSILGILSCSAQSTELIYTLEEVNNTLRNYIIGTDEFQPNDIKEHGDCFIFKKFDISIDYPNFILEYNIGRRVSNSDCWVSTIKNGKYRLVIPITSDIKYPKYYEWFGTKITQERQISITNEDGMEKSTNDKTSIITSYSLYGDEILTTKKLAELLKKLQRIVIAEDFKGRLSNNREKSKKSNNTKSSLQNTVGKKTISGKYGQ